MLTITTKAIRFTADHYLSHLSAEKNVHPHHYQVTLEYTGELVNGMLSDYEAIEPMTVKTLAPLQAVLLNDVPGLENPTAENVVLWILRRIEMPVGTVLICLTVAKDGARCSWRAELGIVQIEKLRREHICSPG